MTFETYSLPRALPLIVSASEKHNFQMASDAACGSLLRALAASKPAGNFLELGTGTGLSTAWILDGLDNKSQLVSIDNDAEVQHIASTYLGNDKRLKLITSDASKYINQQSPGAFDFIFADTWAGKFELLDETLALLKPGGIYVLDDLLPQPNWPDGHGKKVDLLKSYLLSNKQLEVSLLNYSTGLLVAASKEQ